MIKRLVNEKNINFLCFCCILVYEFGFSSLINIRPFNFLFNGFLILLFILTIFKFFVFHEYKNVFDDKHIVFYGLLGVFSFCLIVSDISNGIIPTSPIILVLILFSSFSLCLSDKKYLLKLLFGISISNLLGLTTIVLLNIKEILSIKAIVSMPYQNLDSFASIARNSASFALLLAVFSKEKIYKKILEIVISIVSFVLMILTSRAGSILIFLLSFIILFGIAISKRNKNLFILYFSLVACAPLLLLAFFYKNSIVQRFISAFQQIVRLDYAIEGSIRERVMMIIRDAIFSGKTLFLGFGTNGTFSYNRVVGHNAFGTMILSYGLISFCIYLYFSVMPLKKIKIYKQEPIVTYFLFFNFIIQLFDIVYGMGSISRNNFLILGIVLGLCANLEDNNVGYYVVEI